MRIVREMRLAEKARGRESVNIRPRWMCWENVPGAFSSGTPKYEDFRIVLEEIVRICFPNELIPSPYADMLDKLIPQHDGHTTAAWITFAEELADGAETAFEQEMSSLVAAFQEISKRFSPRAVETVYQVIHAPGNALLSNEILPAAEAAEQGASSQELSDMAASGLFGGGPAPELKM